MQDNDDMIRETYRLAQDTNRQVHKMRRSAFWGRIVSIIVYAALLAAPLWFYMQYLAPVVDQMFNTVKEIRGAGTTSTAQFDALQEAWQKLESHFKPSTSTNSQ